MKWKNTAAWSYSLGLAWRPPDWQESKATVRSHTAGHTVYIVSDELHPHREAIKRPCRAGSPVASSPMRCAFHRFTPVWGGSFKFISLPKQLLWNNIKIDIWKLNLWALFYILKSTKRHDCVDGLLRGHEEQIFVKDKFGLNHNLQRCHKIQLRK